MWQKRREIWNHNRFRGFYFLYKRTSKWNKKSQYVNEKLYVLVIRFKKMCKKDYTSRINVDAFEKNICYCAPLLPGLYWWYWKKDKLSIKPRMKDTPTKGQKCNTNSLWFCSFPTYNLKYNQKSLKFFF